MTTKTEQAVALVDQGVKPFAAAKQVGVSPNGVYLALKKRRQALSEEEIRNDERRRVADYLREAGATNAADAVMGMGDTK